MKRFLPIIVILVVHGRAHAQAVYAFDSGDAVSPIAVVEGPGVSVGEGTVLHPSVGLQTGYISNVFYTASNPTGTGVLRLLAEVGGGSLTDERLSTPTGGTDTSIASQDDNGKLQVMNDQGSFRYRADARLTYDQYLSGDSAVTSQGGLGAGVNVHGTVNPMHTFSFQFSEDYQRLIRATNFESNQDTNRDVNWLWMRLYYQRPAQTVFGYLYYQNYIDVFEESAERFADRMQNDFGARAMWQWLPRTRVFLDASMAVYSGLGESSTKVSSFPLTAVAGIQTLLTADTMLVGEAGYANGFYSSGPSYSSPVIGAYFAYKYSPFGRMFLQYQYLHEDSINANFLRDHVIRAWVEQLFSPFVLVAQAEIHFREYDGITIVDGPPTRNDTIYLALAGIHYNFKNWIAATLDYRLTSIETDYRYMETGVPQPIDPSYVRHELMLGVRAAL